MRKPKEPLLLSTINPFALAEVVARKKFRWGKMKDARKQLSEILNIPKDELFADDSLIVNPTLEVPDGHISENTAQ